MVETAPNVVDATAVDLSSSPHESGEMLSMLLELDLPVDDEFVFDPVESDEEEDNDEESVVVRWEVVANRGSSSRPSRRLRLICQRVDAEPAILSGVRLLKLPFPVLNEGWWTPLSSI